MTQPWKGVLLACDFDNTIAPTGKCHAQGVPFTGVPEENLRAIRRFIAGGGRFAVVTGRAYPAYRQWKEQIPTNCPTALYNGAGIYDFEQEKYLYRLGLPEEIRTLYRVAMEAFPSVGMEVFCWDEAVYAERPNDFLRRHQLLTCAPWVEIDSLEQVDRPIAKLLFEDEWEVLVELEQFLHRQPWYGAYETIFSGKNLLELTARGANKGVAVTAIAEHFGIAREHIYCAGDEENDLSMLTMAQTAFVPEDANPRLREHPFFFVGPCTQHAVADAIAELELRYGSPTERAGE